MSDSESKQATDTSKPILIGLYGISGSGKSYLLNKLKTDTSFPSERFTFYDGSVLIDSVAKGGLDEFRRMSDTSKTAHREMAIAKASEECKKDGRIGVVAGHYMFWEDENDPKPNKIGTEEDWKTYTHIIYLNVDADLVAVRRKGDTNRARNELSLEHLRKWQEMELRELRNICREKRILFTTISDHWTSMDNISLERLMALLKDFEQHSEESNVFAVDNAVEAAVAGQDRLETMLVLDADKTLAPQDTGAMFWKAIHDESVVPNDPLTALFEEQNYSYWSFRQATLLYEEVADVFDTVCDRVAAKVDMYLEMYLLLARAAKQLHVGVVIVTCGLRHVWEKVLKNNNLSHVKVVGGGRLADGYVITGSIKGHVVEKLHDKGLRVLAFGDSSLDIEMFHKADEAFVVVGEKGARSHSMDEELAKAIEVDGLSALQVVLPKTAEHRLDLDKLPKVNLDVTERDFLCKPRAKPMERFIHATGKNAAKLLMTPTRNAANRGHVLRKAHERVGYYLAMEYLGDILGLEEIEIQHVQQRPTDGYRFRHEKASLIVPIMRGGEPMAFGVSKAFKEASFVHANAYHDIKKGNFKGNRTIILVDSVINSGESILEFLKPLREEHPRVRVVIIAGVIQARALEEGGLMAKELQADPNLYLVALRKSDNSYQGKGVTDTGDRLFNTTYL